MRGHFSRSELVCPTPGEGRLATRFGMALEQLCVDLDMPLYLTDAFRSLDHTNTVDGHPRGRQLVIN